MRVHQVLKACHRMIGILVFMLIAVPNTHAERAQTRAFNGPYTGRNLDRVAFPIGGLGAGMFCLEGTGAISHMSVRHTLEFFHEPFIFAALCVLGEEGAENTARVLEGPIPDWKYFGRPRASHGSSTKNYGFPRFRQCEFVARFPFATISLTDAAVPLEVQITGWSPFTPGDADSSSLPVGALEYRFTNRSGTSRKAVFSLNSTNFMGRSGPIGAIDGGFVLYAKGGEDRDQAGAFAFATADEDVVVDHTWFRGKRFDPRTINWITVRRGTPVNNPPAVKDAQGGALSVPFELEPGESKTIRLLTAWYVPKTDLKAGTIRTEAPDDSSAPALCACASGVCPTEGPAPTQYVPWYATKFGSVQDVMNEWKTRYDSLRRRSETFRDTFYDTTLPPEVIEAVAANLTILKTPTVLRQHDGRLWCYEGCSDDRGCCPGSCTHVWNYAQAICHLFPALARGMRLTEYFDGQDSTGRQAFRMNLPITPGGIGNHYDASDGQLGCVMKAYREWRISGNRRWLEAFWPRIKQSLDYAIERWDPRHTGLLEEEHHNTYDINYFGPDSHCSSFYLGALAAAVKMGQELGDDVGLYRELLRKGRERMETELYNGEYFFQIVQKEGLKGNVPLLDPEDQTAAYRTTAERVNVQGPIYQYGAGCLSDGVLGTWMAAVCGLEDEILDTQKVRSHLLAVHKYNLKRDLSAHVNPQRPGFAMGDDGGLLLCSWPRGDKPLLPFVYSDEVWTGIEYQVASHLMLLGYVKEGLDIVRECRKRYDGVRRNPFDEYECGHWYARALSSYGLLQGLTGVRYDAVTKTLYADSKVGDFRSFLATEGGYGAVELKDGKLTLHVKEGQIKVDHTSLK